MENQPLIKTEEWESRFGLEVRRLRQNQRLTQSELAERANISLSAVKNLERGRGSSLSSVVRVARALGRAEWLVAFAPPVPSFSPLDLLRERERASSGARRVRHRAKAGV